MKTSAKDLKEGDFIRISNASWLEGQTDFVEVIEVKIIKDSVSIKWRKNEHSGDWSYKSHTQLTIL